VVNFTGVILVFNMHMSFDIANFNSENNWIKNNPFIGYFVWYMEGIYE
jgi:hypothetical protein